MGNSFLKWASDEFGFDPERIKQQPEGEQVYSMLKQAYLSATWKERHAKGVPVKMDARKFYEKFLSEIGMSNARGFRYFWTDGELTITCQPTLIDAGSFCNFRYRPEWLEKKKALYIEEEQRKAWGGALKFNPMRLSDDEQNLLKEWNSPPIGGFKD